MRVSLMGDPDRIADLRLKLVEQYTITQAGKDSN